MLTLDSERWTGLRHACGSASDIPRWLEALKNGDADLSDAWGHLCHQYSVYSATFAATPHILSYANTAPTDKRVEALSFIGTVHAWRQPDEIATTPADILEWYEHAIPNAANLAVKTFLDERLETTNAIYLLEAVAALQGCKGPGKIISGFAHEEFTIECSECGVELYVWPDKSGGFFAASEDPVSSANAKRTDIEPADEPSEWDGITFVCSDAFAWLYHLSIRAGYSEIAKSLQYLYGNVACPECAHEFNLMLTLENAT